MAHRYSLSLTLLISTLCGVTAETTSSRLQVQIPKNLFRTQGYDHREALFGVPSYGGSIAQNVYYADSDLCDPNVDVHKGYPTRPLDENGAMEPWKSPFILMIDRGTCTFVQKVRNAQRAGAAAVIVADNVCMCDAENDPDIGCKSNAGFSCEYRVPIMSDDGSGSDITIPSFLMFKQDADSIKDEVKNNNVVQVEMAWATPAPDDRVEYDLWTVPTDFLSVEFLQSFKKASVALGEHAYFTPHQYVYDGILANCQGANGENMCRTLCTNSGRYCATDPDNNLDEGISGADVVTEALRRICIWKHFGADDGIGETWWNYVEQFLERCNTPDYFMNKDCINDVYAHAGIEGKVVEQCMKDSGGLEGDVPNSFLDAEIKAKGEIGVVVVPSLYINNSVMRGKLKSSNVFKAVCSGFLQGTEPDICKTCTACSDNDVVDCTSTGYCIASEINPSNKKSSGGVSTGQFVFSMFAITAAFGSVGYWQYKKSQRQMRDQVRGILAEYMPLDEDGKDADGAFSFATASNNGTQIT